MRDLVQLKASVNRKRVAKCLSKLELAKRAGVSYPAAQRACSGRRVRMEIARRILGALAVDPEDSVLLCDDGDDPVGAVG